MKRSNPSKCGHLTCYSELKLHRQAALYLIKVDQEREFTEIFDYYSKQPATLKSVPDLINRYNVFPDEQGILRVRSKCFRKQILGHQEMNPILLSKTSLLTKAIIWDLHERTKHAGFYTLLAEVRKQFFIIHCYSTLKRVTRSCTKCKRFNAHPVNLNQNAYKLDRISPPNIPFRYVFIDHLGPFYVREGNEKRKVWLLILSCLWSRAVNLKICADLSTATFLRALQLHIFDYGMPEKIFSDLGSQLVSGMNTIKAFLSDPHTCNYLVEKGISSVQIEQYFKGNSALGSLVESCVKIVKKLIYGSIGRNILTLSDFEFMIAEVIHIVNKRPVAFKDGLRDNDLVPAQITPEMLLKGYDLASLNIIPDLQPLGAEETDWDHDYIQNSFSKLQNVRASLRNRYNEDFLGQLIQQATNDKSRYVSKTHHKLKKGDLVLIKDKMQKPINFEMARVIDVITNDLDETTGALLLKGNGSKVKYHSESLIPLLSGEESSPQEEQDTSKDYVPLDVGRGRQSAKAAKAKIKSLYDSEAC